MLKFSIDCRYLLFFLIFKWQIEAYSTNQTINYKIQMEELARNLSLVDFTLANTEKSEIFFRLFEFYNSSGTVYREETINSSEFNRDLPTKFLIHGWTSNPETSPWFEPLRREYFSKYECNVIYVDWSAAQYSKTGAPYTYHTCAANAKPIGSYIADFILTAELKLEMVHIIAHSLGSHVAAFAGKSVLEKTGRKIGRITGTDPAAARFEGAKPAYRLDQSDADYVDVIHTDLVPLGFGYIANIGHVDFYANGGLLQPGCPPISVDDNASHARSNIYFIESINTKVGFKARAARSWEDYLLGKYLDEEEVNFGEHSSPQLRGVYYFRTNASPPFAI